MVHPSGRKNSGSRRTQDNGRSPNNSRILRRSRNLGSVAPPTQRFTVLTETPSWRAACSWVSPDRRSTFDIQSAKVAGASACRPDGGGIGIPPIRSSTGSPGASGCECSTSTSTCSGKILNEIWIVPVGPAASSSARNTVWLTAALSAPVSGEPARQRLTNSRISGIEEGRAGNVWDSTTTGRTSSGPSGGSWCGSVTCVTRRPCVTCQSTCELPGIYRDSEQLDQVPWPAPTDISVLLALAAVMVRV
jgi:hypothetical protein